MKAMTVLKNKKGFTLIEIIVVLIILAIMAAAGIPSMIGFIEDSNKKALLAEARVGMVAAQVVATESRGTTAGADILTSDRFEDLTAGLEGVFSAITFEGTGTDYKQVKGITYTKDSVAVTIPYVED